MRLLYVTSARVPGSKAHCSQIAQMCRAFLNAEVDLELIIPARAELPGYKNKTIHGWYGFDKEIPSEKLPCVDYISGTRAGLPQFVYKFTFKLLVWTFNRSLVRFLKNQEKQFTLYSRDAHVFSCLINTFPSVNKIIELHQLEEMPGSTQEIENKVFDACDGIVVVTTPFKDSLVKRGVDAKKILVEYNGVDMKAFPGKIGKEEARKRLNLSPTGRIVLYAGNFHSQGVGRDFGTIVQSIPSILEKYDDTVFLFVGGPLRLAEPYMQTLKDLGVSEKHYLFLDRQPYKKIYLWLGAADILVNLLPNHPKFSKITTTLKEFEYMTSGRPIVASELPGSREVLFNGRNALLIPPSDAEAFSKAVIRLFDEPVLADSLAKQAYEDVLYRTWDARAKRIKNWIKILT